MKNVTQKVNSDPYIINPEYKLIVKTAAIATGLAAGAVLAPWEAVRIIGLTVLTGVGYGIANDMVACRDCIEYFTIGHHYDGKELRNRPLKTLDPTLNALAWGAIATWHVCAIAGTFLAIIARAPVPGLIVKITAAQLAPYLAIGATVTLFTAHILSRSAQKEMAKHPYEKYAGVPLNLQAGWEACNIRNSAGYSALGSVGRVLAVAMIAARVGLIVL
jgi:hypothetical protein